MDERRFWNTASVAAAAGLALVLAVTWAGVCRVERAEATPEPPANALAPELERNSIEPAPTPISWKPNVAPTYCLRTSTLEHISPALVRHLTTEAVEVLAATPLYLCPGDLGPSYNLRGFIVAGPSISSEAADHEALHALDFAARGVPSIRLESVPPEVEAWAHQMHPANWSDAELWPYLAAWYGYDPRAMPPEIAAAVSDVLE